MASALYIVAQWGILGSLVPVFRRGPQAGFGWSNSQLKTLEHRLDETSAYQPIRTSNPIQTARRNFQDSQARPLIALARILIPNCEFGRDCFGLSRPVTSSSVPLPSHRTAGPSGNAGRSFGDSEHFGEVAVWRSSVTGSSCSRRLLMRSRMASRICRSTCASGARVATRPGRLGTSAAWFRSDLSMTIV